MVQIENAAYAVLIGERDSLSVEAARLRRDNAALLAALIEIVTADDYRVLDNCHIAQARAAIAQSQEPT